MSNTKTFSIAEIIDKLQEIGKGEFHRIRFFSEPKTIDGSIIRKVVTTTIRTKIDHTHMKSYEEPSFHRNEESTYLVSDALKHNEKTGNYLLKVAPLWDTWKVEYEEADGTPISKEEATARIKPSSKKDGEPPIIITVNAKNILEF